MDPCPGVSRFHCVEGCFVEAVIASALASKVKLGMFFAFPLLNGALDWKWDLHSGALHVSFDLLKMLFTEMLDGVPHGIRFENRHSIFTGIVGDSFLSNVSAVRGRDCSDMVGAASKTGESVGEGGS